MLGKPEEYIIRKYDESLYLYFLVGGKIAIYINSPYKGKIKGEYFERKEGDILGEIGVVMKTERTAYAVSLDYTIMSRITAKNYIWCAKMDHQLDKSVRKQITKYEDTRTILVKKIIKDTLFMERLRFKPNKVHRYTKESPRVDQ